MVFWNHVTNENHYIPNTRVPMTTRLGRMVTLTGSYLMIIWSRHLSRSRDKLKPLYLHKNYAYGHQTWQDGDLPWRVPTHKVTWLFDHVVLRDHLASSNYYISTTAVPMATRLCRIVRYFEVLLTINSCWSLITWPC